MNLQKKNIKIQLFIFENPQAESRKIIIKKKKKKQLPFFDIQCTVSYHGSFSVHVKILRLYISAHNIKTSI